MCDTDECLVLVDELDLHLHPRWQVELVPRLKKVFPLVQFVVTTHSPMLLPGFKKNEVILAKARPDAFLPYLATSLTNFGVIQSALRQHEAALASTQEAIAIRSKLNA